MFLSFVRLIPIEYNYLNCCLFVNTILFFGRDLEFIEILITYITTETNFRKIM